MYYADSKAKSPWITFNYQPTYKASLLSSSLKAEQLSYSFLCSRKEEVCFCYISVAALR